jgi:hypothetical protein
MTDAHVQEMTVEDYIRASCESYVSFLLAFATPEPSPIATVILPSLNLFPQHFPSHCHELTAVPCRRPHH